jgi:hypothetical protein
MKAKTYRPTPEQKAKWNKKYFTRRKKEGWKFLGFCVPVDIAQELHELKSRLMTEYLAATKRAKEN